MNSRCTKSVLLQWGLIFLMLSVTPRLLASECQNAVKKLTPGQTLIVAAFRLDVVKVKTLLESGVDPNTRLGFYDGNLFRDDWSLAYSHMGSDKWTALMAVANSHREPQPPERTKNTTEALDRATKARQNVDTKAIKKRDQRRLQIAKMLIEHEAKLDMDDGYGGTALASAIYSQYESLALLLLKSGASPNTKTRVYIDGPDNITPLHRATGMPAVVKEMIKRGANVNVTDSSGHTPLHWAVMRPNAECVRLLINAGADIRAQTNKGATPDKYATTGGVFFTAEDDMEILKIQKLFKQKLK